MEASAVTDEPRRSPEPCCEGCPGWAVFNLGFDTEGIQRCDGCWSGVEGAPEDDYYQAHPVCVAELARVGSGPEECEDNDCAGCAWCDLVQCADCGGDTSAPGGVHVCEALDLVGSDEGEVCW